MIIGIHETALQCVVVDIAVGLGPDPVDTHPFKLQVGHSTGCILGQGLVDFQPDRRAGLKVGGLSQMFIYNFLSEAHFHRLLLLSIN